MDERQTTLEWKRQIREEERIRRALERPPTPRGYPLPKRSLIRRMFRLR